MAVAIGGRAVAIYAVGGTLNAVNQFTWQTVAQNVLSAIGGPISGVSVGALFNIFVDVISDGTNNYVRAIFDDVQVADGTSVAAAAGNFSTAMTALAVRTVLAGFSSEGVGGITLSSVSFEPWGDGFVPGP